MYARSVGLLMFAGLVSRTLWGVSLEPTPAPVRLVASAPVAAVVVAPSAAAAVAATETPEAVPSPTRRAARFPFPTPESELLPTLDPAPKSTVTPVPTATPIPEPTWPVPADLRAASRGLRARVRPARLDGNAATALDPAALPGTLAGVHFAGPSAHAAELFGSAATVPSSPGATPPVTAWSVEVVYATDTRWEEQTIQALVDAYERGFRPIVRIDYARKQPIPPADDAEAVARYAEAFVRIAEETEGRVRFFVIGNEGNVDEPGDDPGRNTECLEGRHTCSPASYARVYRAVRRALRTQTDAYVLIGPASPGPAGSSGRWMDGYSYLKGILDLMHPLEVDGIALHAYGDQPGAALGRFAQAVEAQVKAAHDAGYVSTPIFVTEMNNAGRPDPAFIAQAFAWIDAHNRRSPQDIVAACWFVFFDETGQWREMSLAELPEATTALGRAADLPPGR